jgi:hypothetical protein
MSCPFYSIFATRRERIINMAGPKEIEDRIKRTTSGWESLAPTKSFFGMTLDQFKTAVQPSRDARERIKDLENQLTQAINERDAADEVSLAKIQGVVAGVNADPTEGPDSSLIEAFGYTRKSERKSGLGRKGGGAGDGGTKSAT